MYACAAWNVVSETFRVEQVFLGSPLDPRFGGIAPSARAHIGWLARRAKGKHARDSTKYGLSRASTKSFYLHHTQRLSLAAVLGDAKGIRRKLNGEKAKRIAGGDARATSI